MSVEINNEKKMFNCLDNFLSKKSNFKNKQNELNKMGKKILINFYKEIYLLTKNEI